MERIDPERLKILRSALGKPESEVRVILRLHDGNVYRHELDAVLLKLHSTNQAFNEAVHDRLVGKPFRNPYSLGCEYPSAINYDTGWEACELAVELHGPEAVRGSL